MSGDRGGGELDDVAGLSDLIRDNDLRIFKKDTNVYDIINVTLERSTTSDESALCIIDIAKIVRQYRRWVELLPSVTPYYAIKCNPNPVILRVLASLGCNFDCASMAEIALAVSATGGDPSRVIFANPAKQISHIKFARGNDVDLMTFDTECELYKIKLFHPNSELLMRILVNDAGSACRFGSKFGVAPEDVGSLLTIAAALKLNVTGVAFHVGSSCGNPTRYAEAIRDAREVFRVASTHGFTMNVLDIGGGYPGIDVDDESESCGGVHANDNDDMAKPPPLSFERVAEVINAALVTEFGDANLRVIAEPGRYMVANSHTIVLNVISKKEKTLPDGDKEFVYFLNDGAYGSFSCIMYDHAHPVICPFNERDGKKHKSKLFGPTCDSIDLIVEETMLPELAIGEYVYVESFGAYTTATSTGFNGFAGATPVYIMTC